MIPSRQPFSHPTAQPSIEPSQQPSGIPTQPSSQPTNQPTTGPTQWTAPIIRFEQSLTLDHVNGSLSSLTIEDQDIVVLATAKDLSIDPHYVTFQKWSLLTRRNLGSVGTGTIVATTIVQVSTLLFPDFESSDTTGIYTFLVEKIKASISTGDFTKVVQTFATQYGSTALVTCSVSSVSVSQPYISSPIKGSSPELSASDITGIVFGAVFAVIFILAACIYNYAISNATAKKIRKKVATTLLPLPRYQKNYRNEYAINTPSIPLPSNELKANIELYASTELYADDIEVGEEKLKPLILPNQEISVKATTDDLLIIKCADFPNKSRELVRLTFVDKIQDAHQPYVRPPISPIIPEPEPQPEPELELESAPAMLAEAHSVPDEHYEATIESKIDPCSESFEHLRIFPSIELETVAKSESCQPSPLNMNDHSIVMNEEDDENSSLVTEMLHVGDSNSDDGEGSPEHDPAVATQNDRFTATGQVADDSSHIHLDDCLHLQKSELLLRSPEEEIPLDPKNFAANQFEELSVRPKDALVQSPPPVLPEEADTAPLRGDIFPLETFDEQFEGETRNLLSYFDVINSAFTLKSKVFQ